MALIKYPLDTPKSLHAFSGCKNNTPRDGFNKYFPFCLWYFIFFFGSKRITFTLFKRLCCECEFHPVICFCSSCLSHSQLTCSTSCCRCWTFTRSLFVTISTVYRCWLTVNRTETLTSCSNSTSPTLPVRAACWRRSSLTPCLRYSPMREVFFI